MQNYNQQQQAVILKGIAQQILQMNVPSFEVVSKLFNEFGIKISEAQTKHGEDSEQFDPYEWLYNTYRIVRDQIVVKNSGDKTKRRILIVKTTNGRHFKTKYPVVLLVSDGEHLETLTLEQIDIEAATKASEY